MNRKFRWTIIILALAASFYFMLPLGKQINLGLDLQGGMHVVLSVDTEKALEAKMDSIVYQLKREMQTDKLPFTYVEKSGVSSIEIGGSTLNGSKEIAKLAEKYILKGNFAGDKISLALDSAEVERIRQSAVLQSLEVVRNRIDKFGVTEPLIQKQGKDQIIVQLPGVTDPDRAINLIGQTAQLKFYIVDDTVTAEALAAGNVPYNTSIFYGKTLEKNTGKVISTTAYALKSDAVLTGDSIMDSTVQYDQFGAPAVGFRFDALGAKQFADLTAANTGKRLAIVLDDNVYSAPNINEKIPGGQGIISGSFTLEQAQDLSVVLKAGSLPAPVKIEENRTVGPSLGKDSIKSGVKASVIGLALICVFMLVYYKLSGLVANIGLVCNFVMLLGLLCALKATLTLPGIAGIILTLGIAVDSNVLIFERVREELRHGRTVRNAFDLGYQKAFATIVDANVTSLIASLVLFQFGTGPVKGFAVTLSLGLIVSMFTAVFITKSVFMDIIIRKDTKSISI